MLKAYYKSLPFIANIGLLMILLLFVYSLIGMQFFKGPRPLVNGIEPRYDFSSIVQAMITVFISLTGDGWNEIMYVFVQ